MRDLVREQLLRELLELRPQFENDGVTHMTLFGSRARNDHRPDSDVDLMIEVDETRKFSLLDVIGIGHIIEDNIGLPANIFMKRSLDADFLDETKPDLIPVF